MSKMAHFTILTRTLTKRTEWGGFNPAGVKFCQLRMSLFKCHVQNYLFNFYIIPKKCWRTVSKIMWIEEWRRIEGKETGKNRTNIVPETTAFKFRNKISKGTTLQDTEPRQLPTADCKFSRRYILTGGSWLKPVSWKVAEYLDMPNCSTANAENTDVLSDMTASDSVTLSRLYWRAYTTCNWLWLNILDRISQETKLTRFN